MRYGTSMLKQDNGQYAQHQGMGVDNVTVPCPLQIGHRGFHAAHDHQIHQRRPVLGRLQIADRHRLHPAQSEQEVIEGHCRVGAWCKSVSFHL